MSKYTPWNARYIEEEHAWRISDGYSEIGMGFGPANARLIAAAPEAIDACRAFLVAWTDEARTRALELAAAAIAKAEGRES